MLKDIEDIWNEKENTAPSEATKKTVQRVIDSLSDGKIRVCEKISGEWVVEERVKKAILLRFKFWDSKIYSGGYSKWYDKIAPRFDSFTETDFKSAGIRAVPGSLVREGAYIGKNVVLMPSFVNIGAYVGGNSMVDSWSTVGSCAQIGSGCHISGGVGIGGVLEPIGDRPVVIEDNCFIGARSEIAEGVIIEEGSVIGMGVYLASSTKIVDRDSGEIFYGKVPPFSVVVPGCLPSKDGKTPGLYCAVIIKKVDESTKKKTSINDLLREN